MLFLRDFQIGKVVYVLIKDVLNKTHLNLIDKSAGDLLDGDIVSVGQKYTCSFGTLLNVYRFDAGGIFCMVRLEDNQEVGISAEYLSPTFKCN